MPFRLLSMAGIVLFTLAGCTGTGLGLRGVGAPPRQDLAASEPPPQVVTSDFAGPDSTVPREAMALDGTPQALTPVPAGTPHQSPVQQTASTRPATRPAPRPVAQQTATTLQSVVPPPAASDRFTPQPEMANSREAAIRQMREKAAATEKKPPNIFDIPQSRSAPLDENELQQLRRRMEAAADENAANVTAEEAEQRQESTKRLLRKAGTHYKDALSSIEK
jgi:hypothetical protein